MSQNRIVFAPIYIEDNYGLPLKNVKIEVIANYVVVGTARTNENGQVSIGLEFDRFGASSISYKVEHPPNHAIKSGGGYSDFKEYNVSDYTYRNSGGDLIAFALLIARP